MVLYNCNVIGTIPERSNGKVCKTFVHGFESRSCLMDGQSTSHWDKTIQLNERLAFSPFFTKGKEDGQEVGFYGDRRIIGRDTPINKGVYLGSGNREAIVVDDEKYPEELNEVYNQVLAAVSPDIGLFVALRNVVRDRLGGTQGDKVMLEVEKIYEELDKSETQDPKVKLNTYIKRNAGVCRHRALLAGYVLERLIKEKKLYGTVSVDRSSDGDYGHAWVRFVPKSGGEVVIIDPSLGFVGKLSGAPKIWDYRRPGE